MWNDFKNWIRHLLDSHCPHCIDERRARAINPEVELLKEMLEYERAEKRKLLDLLTKPVENSVQAPDLRQMLPIQRRVPWAQRQAQLEQMYRKPVKELEKEAGIETEVENG